MGRRGGLWSDKEGEMMAAFQEVMRQFDRMCKASCGCVDCPLHEPDGVSDRCSIGAFVNDSEHIEREIMSWAAEHPEPVYPTWYEWLNTTPFMEKVKCGNGTYKVYNWKKPIPDDIAEKLGIEPKEAR